MIVVVVPLTVRLPPTVTSPVVDRLVRVPTDVILPCAAVVTVPAVVALDTVPVTLAPATEFALAATVADATAALLILAALYGV